MSKKRKAKRRQPISIAFQIPSAMLHGFLAGMPTSLRPEPEPTPAEQEAGLDLLVKQVRDMNTQAVLELLAEVKKVFQLPEQQVVIDTLEGMVRFLGKVEEARHEHEHTD